MNAWVAKFLRCSLAGHYCEEVYGGELCAANPYKTCVVRGRAAVAAEQLLADIWPSVANAAFASLRAIRAGVSMATTVVNASRTAEQPIVV